MGDQSYRCAACPSACVDGSLEKRQGHGVGVQFGTDAQWHRDIWRAARNFRLADAEAAIAAFSAGTRGKLVLLV